MSQPIFPQNVISVIWDFDKTLIRGYMQEPLFRHFGVDGSQFWKEVGALAEYYHAQGIDRINQDTLYLSHMLSYVRHGKFPGLNNALLRKFGEEMDFYPGLPDFFGQLRDRFNQPPWEKHDIRVEHYIVSTGLRQTILGSKIAPFVEAVWGCEFAENEPGPGFLDKPHPLPPADKRVIDHVVYTIDNTSKTRAAFEINKGTSKVPAINVNSNMPPEERRVPFRNMVYIADGPSDIPVFSLLRQYGGRTFAVYRKGSEGEFAQVCDLQLQGRIEAFGEANYEPGEQASMWINKAVEDIAKRMVRERAESLDRKVGKPPRHLDD